MVTTDIYVKPTDAHRYLSYTSYHPKHIFRSVVYSQALGYRRIISDEITVSLRLNDLETYFIDCGYPKKMVNDIIKDVK